MAHILTNETVRPCIVTGTLVVGLGGEHHIYAIGGDTIGYKRSYTPLIAITVLRIVPISLALAGLAVAVS